MTKPVLAPSMERRMQEVERQLRDARFGTADPGLGLRYLPDGRVMLPSGDILGSHQESFSMPGALTAALSPAWYPMVTEALVSWFFSLGTAGSTDTTLKVYRSGVALTPTGAGSSTITFPAGDTVLKVYFPREVFVADVDGMQVETVTLGTGARDLTGQARFG